MAKGSRMALLAGAVFFAVACGSTKLRVSPQDGAADTGSGGVLGTGGTGTGTLGSGGTAVTTLPGSGGGAGGTTGSGGVGSGGRPSTGGSPGSGGSPGTGGAFQDAAAVDVARDQAGGSDLGQAPDAFVECDPSSPDASWRPAGDGCNNCWCLTNGRWFCETKNGTGLVDVKLDTPLLPSDTRMDSAAPDGGPTGCAQVTTQTECEARKDCHPVFFDPGGCACPELGCCASFDHCGDGAMAACTGTALCKRVEPHCEGPYVIAYKDSCYEGCVLRIDCAP